MFVLLVKLRLIPEWCVLYGGYRTHWFRVQGSGFRSALQIVYVDPLTEGVSITEASKEFFLAVVEPDNWRGGLGPLDTIPEIVAIG